MSKATLGFAPHSGWAALVAVGADAARPRVLLRERIEMADPRLVGSKQPYHEIEGMPLREAERRLEAQPSFPFPPHRPGVGSSREVPMEELTPSEERALLRLARRSIEATLSGAEPPDPYADVDPEAAPALLEHRGVFVTLHRRGRLRGCIGTIHGTQPLVEEVAEQALHAAFDDPRFPPLAHDELPGIDVEITVLTPPRRVPVPEQIEIGRHGVLLEKEGHRAVFLPQVAVEQGWDRPTLLRHLSRKAGLPADAWENGSCLEVFEGQVLKGRD